MRRATAHADVAHGEDETNQVVRGAGSVAVQQRRFVVHEHRRPRHHFDLRLEEHGALRSWALPRVLPVTLSADRLAIAVDDHGLDHLTYTDADTDIADTGTWQEEDRDERRLVFTLHGSAGVMS